MAGRVDLVARRVRRGRSSTTLTAETPSTKPSDGFRLTPTTAEPELGLYRPLVERRSSGRPDTFEETVVATYVAGRFATRPRLTSDTKRPRG